MEIEADFDALQSMFSVPSFLLTRKELKHDLETSAKRLKPKLVAKMERLLDLERGYMEETGKSVSPDLMERKAEVQVKLDDVDNTIRFASSKREREESDGDAGKEEVDGDDSPLLPIPQPQMTFAFNAEDQIPDFPPIVSIDGKPAIASAHAIAAGFVKWGEGKITPEYGPQCSSERSRHWQTNQLVRASIIRFELPRNIDTNGPYKLTTKLRTYIPLDIARAWTENPAFASPHLIATMQVMCAQWLLRQAQKKEEAARKKEDKKKRKTQPQQ